MSVGCIALLLSSGANIVAPYFFGMVIDVANETKDNSRALGREVLILGIIYLVGSIAAFFRAWMFTWAGQRLVARIRRDVFAAIVRQDIAFFDVNRTGELTNRLSSDTAVIQNGALQEQEEKGKEVPCVTSALGSSREDAYLICVQRLKRGYGYENTAVFLSVSAWLGPCLLFAGTLQRLKNGDRCVSLSVSVPLGAE